MTTMFDACLLLLFPVFLLAPTLSIACTQPNGCKPLLLAQQPVGTETAAVNKAGQPAIVLQDKMAPGKPKATMRTGKPFYEVKTGDTLYAIGVKNGLRYETIAHWNQLPPSYKILAGQKLKLFGPQQQANSRPVNKKGDDDSAKNQRSNAAKTVTASTKSQPKTKRITEKKSVGQIKQPAGKQDGSHHGLTPPPPAKDNVAIADKNQSGNLAPLQKGGVPKKVQRVVKKAENQSPEKGLPHAKSGTEPANNNQKKPPRVVTNQRRTDKVQKKAIISVANKKLLKLDFKWPIKGAVAKGFAKTYNKGIDIAGTEKQQPVSASEAGTVVYQGEGLVGFKNLIIIKHNDEYLSAYANNSRMLVKEGQQVKQGQTIAEIGKASPKQKPLHFEIRKNGNPVDPLYFLPK